MMMMYGYAPASLHDPVIRLADEGTKLLASLSGSGGTPINIFPILRYLPFYRAYADGSCKSSPGNNNKKLNIYSALFI